MYASEMYRVKIWKSLKVKYFHKNISNLYMAKDEVDKTSKSIKSSSWHENKTQKVVIMVVLTLK